LGSAGATCALDKGAVLTQLCSYWLYGIEVEVSVGHKPKFGPSAFCAPLEVAPVARAMPAIP